MRETNHRLGDEIRAVVERQFQQSEPAEVNHAVDRLIERGHSRERAIDTVGTILLEEIHEMMTENEIFDRERYVDRLEDLSGHRYRTVRTEAFVAVQQVETFDTEAVARCGGDRFEKVYRSLVFRTWSVAISTAWQRRSPLDGPLGINECDVAGDTELPMPFGPHLPR